MQIDAAPDVAQRIGDLASQSTIGLGWKRRRERNRSRLIELELATPRAQRHACTQRPFLHRDQRRHEPSKTAPVLRCVVKDRKRPDERKLRRLVVRSGFETRDEPITFCSRDNECRIANNGRLHRHRPCEQRLRKRKVVSCDHIIGARSLPWCVESPSPRSIGEQRPCHERR
jgi:hypothetical protein